MSGTVIPLITKRDFNFDNGTATVTVVKAVPVSQYTEGVLLVRVHSSGIASSSTLEVRARTTAPTAEEPSVDFVNDTSMASVSLDSDAAAGDLERAALTDDFGAFLQIQVEGTQDGGNCNAVISADLVLKD